jgi:hypothetical protein
MYLFMLLDCSRARPVGENVFFYMPVHTPRYMLLKLQLQHFHIQVSQIAQTVAYIHASRAAGCSATNQDRNYPLLVALVKANAVDFSNSLLLKNCFPTAA